MINLRNSPFLWFALLLLLAYGLSEWVPQGRDWITTLVLWVVCLGCTLGGMIPYKPGFQLWSTLSIGVLLLAAGFIRVTHFQQALFKGDAIDVPMRMDGIVTVAQVLKVKEHGTTLRCMATLLTSQLDSTQLQFADKYVVVQIRDIHDISFLPGDRIQVQGWVSALKGPLNPNAFDIRAYYLTLGIRHQIFCKGSEIQLFTPQKNSITRITAKWQSTLSAIVSAHTSSDVAQLTNALVWGDRSDMNAEVRDAFADSGAMHVLSVSGMHMAMIYSMLYLILGSPSAGTFLRRMIRLGCYVLAILCYVALTGASPAVVRAGLMIILYLVGKAMGWNTQIWNLLGFAAFLMLWINPFIWRNIGFQLSFLAMAGILFYTKPISRSLSFKSIILQRIWDITAVSLAAQIFIVPVLLSQFHQFPLTFIASSLVAMPAGYIVIFGALLNVALSVVGIEWFWIWLDYAGYYFILSMKWMAGLNPTMHFSLPSAGGILMSVMAASFSAALVYQWAWGKKIAYASGVLVIIIMSVHRMAQWKSDELIVYHHYKGLIVDVIRDGYCISIQDTALLATSIEFGTRGHRCQRDVKQILNVSKHESFLSRGWGFTSSALQFGSSSILIWNESEFTPNIKKQPTCILVDQVKDPKLLFDFIMTYPDTRVIIPAHLERKSKYTLLKFMKENKIEYFDISMEGYYKMEL